MRSFTTILALLFAIFAFTLAQEYDATVYITSTVYRVNTVTMSGTPTGSVANSTSTISATHTPVYSPSAPMYPSGNATGVAPTGSYPSTTGRPEFEGAASALSVSGFVAMMAVGVGYLAL